MKVSNTITLFHLVILSLLLYSSYKSYPFVALLLLSVYILLDVLEVVVVKKRVRSFIHPFLDKIIVFTSLFMFTIVGSFSVPFLFLFLLRDIIVGIIRILASRDDLPIRGEWYGKTITSLQFVLVFAILLQNLDRKILLDVGIFLLTLAILFVAALSVAQYGYVYLTGLRTRRIHGRKIEREKMVILANKKSGGYKNVYRRRLLNVFSKKRNAPIIYLPENKNMYFGIDAKIRKYKEVVIAGGDGSFEGALNTPALQQKSLGFFPLGAGNSYYSYFYKGKRFEYLRSRFTFQEVLLDILELEWDKGKVETTFLGIGVDAEVARRIKDKKHHTFSDYFMSSTKIAFSDYKVHYDLECEADGKKYRWKNAINLIIGKVPYIGFGLRSVVGEVDDADGYILGTACVSSHSPFFNKALRLWAIVLTQMGLEKPPLVSLKGKVFTIRSKEPFPLQAGGEFLGYTSYARVRVKRQQKVLMIYR